MKRIFTLVAVSTASLVSANQAPEAPQCPDCGIVADNYNAPMQNRAQPAPQPTQYENTQGFQNPHAQPATSAADLAVAKKIQDALSTAAFSKGFGDIKFRISGGQVTLGGTVNSAADRQKLEAAIKKIDGVKEVKNDITIRPQAPQQQQQPTTR